MKWDKIETERASSPIKNRNIYTIVRTYRKMDFPEFMIN
jgi:hypothetical protein